MTNSKFEKADHTESRKLEEQPNSQVAPVSCFSFREKAAVLVIFIALASFYSLSMRGAFGCSFSYRWLADAIWDDASFEVTKFADQKLLDDHSANKNHRYIHWPPGPAIFAMPFYGLGRLINDRPNSTLPELLCGAESRLMGLFFPFCAAAAVLFLFGACRIVCRSNIVVSAITIGFAFGFYIWPYAPQYTRHIPTITLFSGALFASLLIHRNYRSSYLYALLLTTGLLPLFDYSTMLLVPVFFALAIHGWKSAAGAPRALAIGVFLFLIGPVILGVYNTLCFGAPWITSYANSVQHEWARSFSTTFIGPIIEGLRFLLFNEGPIPQSIIARTGFPDAFREYYTRQSFQGVLRYAPFLWLALPGVVIAIVKKERRHVTLGLLSLALPTILLMSKHRTLFGGSNFDPRYIFHVTPALFVLGALALDYLLERFGHGRRWFEGLVALIVLSFFAHAAFQNIRAIATDTVRAAKHCPALLPPDASILNALFPGADKVQQYIPALLLFSLIALGLWELVQKIDGRRT